MVVQVQVPETSVPQAQAVVRRNLKVKGVDLPDTPMPSITIGWRWVGPTLAQELLDKMRPRQRHKRELWVERLVKIHEEGEFVPTHQGIGIDIMGRTVDGQHRLTMVVRAGKGCWMLVAEGLDDAAVLAIDLHAKRKPEDQIRMIDDILNPSAADVAIARSMSSGCDGSGNREILNSTFSVHRFLEQHWEAITFSKQYMKARRVCVASVRAAVAKAWYYEDREKLLAFMRVLGTLEANGPREFAAISFRKWLDDEKNLHIINGGFSMRAVLHRMTVAAIQAFLKGQTGRRIVPVEEDPWPLPDAE
jgi:hypothetical protein